LLKTSLAGDDISDPPNYTAPYTYDDHGSMLTIRYRFADTSTEPFAARYALVPYGWYSSYEITSAVPVSSSVAVPRWFVCWYRRCEVGFTITAPFATVFVSMRHAAPAASSTWSVSRSRSRVGVPCRSVVSR